MIISDRKQFVFIHNPKCAGMAFRAALMPFDTTGDLFWLHDRWNGHEIDKAHMPLFVLRARFPDYFSRLESYFTFMVVRNPFTRAISGFNEVNPDIYRQYTETGDLPSYRHELNRFLSQLGSNQLKGWDMRYRHFVRQVDFAFIGRKCLVDAFIRYEEMAASLAKLKLFDAEVADVLLNTPRSHERPVAADPNKLLDHRTVRNLLAIYESDFLAFDYVRHAAANIT